LTGEGPVIWDFATGKILARVKLQHVRAVSFDSQSQRLFCLTDDSLLAVELAGKSGEPSPDPAIMFRGNNLKSLAVADDGSIAAADFGASSLHLLSGTNHTEIPLPIQPLEAAFSPDGRWLACGSYLKNDIYICDARHSGLPPVRLAGAGSLPVFSADGKRLFTFGREALVWNTSTWQRAPPLPLEASNAESFIGAVSRDGRWLAATQRNREVQVVALAAGNIVANLDGPGESGILALAFSPDGNTLVIARDRGDLQLWPLPALNAELQKIGLDW
jgi:WD40 repeat protein